MINTKASQSTHDTTMNAYNTFSSSIEDEIQNKKNTFVREKDEKYKTFKTEEDLICSIVEYIKDDHMFESDMVKIPFKRGYLSFRSYTEYDGNNHTIYEILYTEKNNTLGINAETVIYHQCDNYHEVGKHIFCISDFIKGLPIEIIIEISDLVTSFIYINTIGMKDLIRKYDLD